MGFDKKALRDNLFYPVLVGIVLTVAGAIGTLVFSETFRNRLRSAFFISWTWLQHPFPAWMTLVSVLLVILVIVGYRKRSNTMVEVEIPEHEQKYREDQFFHLRWRWKYRNGEPVAMTPYCLEDDTEQAKIIQMSAGIELDCETCGKPLFLAYESPKALAFAVRRQIERKIRNEEWQVAVAQSAGKA
jgi:hypothetical protein